MFLYSKNGSKIEVFDMKPDMKKVTDYKKEQIANAFGAGGRIITAFSTDSKILENPVEEINLKDVENEECDYMGRCSYSRLEREESSLQTHKLLEKYYKNEYSSNNIKRIVDRNFYGKLHTLRYLLLTEPRYTSARFTGYCMENIIELNQSLFYLQLLEQGSFNRLVDKDISEQLALYNITYHSDISINSLQKMYDVDLLPGAFEGVMSNVETTQKILSKTKR